MYSESSTESIIVEIWVFRLSKSAALKALTLFSAEVVSNNFNLDLLPKFSILEFI